jgi:hypothetical protein
LLGYAWWAVSLAPFSATATAVVVVSGGAAMVWGVVRGFDARTLPHAGGTGAWVALAVAVGLWQLAAYLQHPREDHPTLSSLTNALLEAHPARAAAFALWVACAAALGRR